MALKPIKPIQGQEVENQGQEVQKQIQDVSQTQTSKNVNSTKSKTNETKDKKGKKKETKEQQKQQIDVKELVKSLSSIDSFTQNLTINSFVSQLGENIVVPDFQRSKVWDDTNKSKLIYSILNNEGIGLLTLVEDNDKNLILLDGLQRISTINEFLNGEFKVKFKENDLENLTNQLLAQYLNGKTFEDLDKQIQNIFLNANITIDKKIIRDTEKFEELLIEIFNNINTTATKLTKGELLYSTLFTKDKKRNEKIKLIAEYGKRYLPTRKDRKKSFVILARILSTTYLLRKYNPIKEDNIVKVIDQIPELKKYRSIWNYIYNLTKQIRDDENYDISTLEEDIQIIVEDIYGALKESFEINLIKQVYYSEIIPIILYTYDALMTYYDEIGDDKSLPTINELTDFFIEEILGHINLPPESEEEYMKNRSDEWKEKVKTGEIKANGNLKYLIGLFKQIGKLNSERNVVSKGTFEKRIIKMVELVDLMFKLGIFEDYMKHNLGKTDFEFNYETFKKVNKEEGSLI